MRYFSGVFVEGLREKAGKFLSQGSWSVDGGLNSSVPEYRTGVLTYSDATVSRYGKK